MDIRSPDDESQYHDPVLVREVVELLRGRSLVLDGTLGGGGHTLALLAHGGVSTVIGVDRDPDAIVAARARLSTFEREGRFRPILGNYADLGDTIPLPDEPLDGVLLDLGVSSRQIDSEARGFTFREGAPLDMRMSPDSGATAAEWLDSAPENELESAFREFGDEPRARRLAREVVRRRSSASFATSDDFVRAIRGALGPRSGPSDFARLFQAVRIAVNDELTGLRAALPRFRDHLSPQGMLVVIAYHSGEDRIVKNEFRDWSASCVCPPRHIVCTCRGRPLGTSITRRAVSPEAAEVERNPRARSARLRAWRKAG